MGTLSPHTGPALQLPADKGLAIAVFASVESMRPQLAARLLRIDVLVQLVVEARSASMDKDRRALAAAVSTGAGAGAPAGGRCIHDVRLQLAAKGAAWAGQAVVKVPAGAAEYRLVLTPLWVDRAASSWPTGDALSYFLLTSI